MDMEKRDRLIAAGIDLNSALERMMGNDALLERFLKRFLDDANYGRLSAAIEAGDAGAALTASHTLKGVCGNLSMQILFDLLTRQVAALRADDFADAAALMPEITAAYTQVTDAIRGCYLV